MNDMSLAEALKWLKISNLGTEDEKSIKKVYRRLMKVAHPDSGGCTDTAAKISEAYSIVIDALKNKTEKVTPIYNKPFTGFYNNKTETKKIYRLSLSDILKILRDRVANVEIDGIMVSLTAQTIANNILNISDNATIDITYENQLYTFNKRVASRVHRLDQYDIDIRIADEMKEYNIPKSSLINLCLKVGEVTIDINTDSNTIARVINIDKAQICLRIER